MKITNVEGVECAMAMVYGPDDIIERMEALAVDLGLSESVCALCPCFADDKPCSDFSGNSYECDGGAFVPLKFVPLLQMRGIPFEQDLSP